jgi:inner membrane protein
VTSLDVIDTLGGWLWWVLGLFLFAAEVLLPGFYFLWCGIAAILIGISALLVDWPWQLQVVGFLALAAIAVLVARRFAGRGAAESR